MEHKQVEKCTKQNVWLKKINYELRVYKNKIGSVFMAHSVFY